MKRLLIISGLLLLLNACSTVPPIPDFRVEKGAKIGIFVDISAVLIHRHESTLAFQDFEKTYEINPGLNEYVKDKMTDALSRVGGYEVVDLNALGYSRIELASLVTLKEGAWLVPPQRTSLLKKLKNKLGLKAVVVIKEQRAVAGGECYGPYGCRTTYMSGHGLFTKGTIVGDFYTAVAGYQTDIFVLDPPFNLALAPRSTELGRWERRGMKAVPKSSDFRKISRETWDYTVKTIKYLMDQLAVVTTKLLAEQAIGKPQLGKF